MKFAYSAMNDGGDRQKERIKNGNAMATGHVTALTDKIKVFCF
jgi:hypothetical protein